MTEDEVKKEDGQIDLPVPEKQRTVNVQERPAFDDKWVIDEEKGGSRMPVLHLEQKERMDDNIAKLGRLFEGSDIKWQLDGALNISLMNGEYIGVHKDIDLSIEDADLEKLEVLLSQKDYGLFLSSKKQEDPTKRNMEQVSAQKFREASPDHYMIAAVDKEGKLREDESLDEIDVHLIKRDSDGNPIFGGITLPKKWYEAQPINFQEQNINLSHPARVAFFKIHSDRSYDRTDLSILAQSGRLTIEDVTEIEQSIDNEASARLSLAEQIIERIAEGISPEMSAEQIFEVFYKDPLVAKNIEKNEGMLRTLSKRIAEGDHSKEEIKNLAFEAFEIQAPILKQRQKVRELRSWVEDAKELEETKKDLQSKF